MQTKLDHLQKLSLRAMQNVLRERVESHGQLSRMLHGLSPLPTLSRGYAVLRKEDGQVVSSVEHVTDGEKFTAVLSDGTVHGSVEHTTKKTLEDGS